MIFFTLASASLIVGGCSPTDPDIDCPRSLRSYPPSSTPSWHPEGHLIAFNHAPIAEIVDYDPRCGGTVRVDREAGGVFGIFDGEAPTKLLPVRIGDPSWSPTGDRLAFVAAGNIFTIAFEDGAFDTTSVIQLTTGGNNYHAAWSPDGVTIAYTQVGCDNPPPPWPKTCGARIMALNGSTEALITTGSFPSWFPDSRRLLHVGLHHEFFVYDFADAASEQLTYFENGATNKWPTVSPDGALIAFASQQMTSPVNIWLVNSDGSRPRRLTTEGTLSTFCWSPDSQSILYINYKASDFSENNGSLWMINVHSLEKHRLVHGSLK